MNRRRRQSLAIALLLLLLAAGTAAGCAGGPKDDAPTGPEAPGLVMPVGTAVPVTRFGDADWSYTDFSRFTEPARIVVRDEARWRALWPSIAGSARPAPEPPAVDFSRDMVVIATLGARGSSGYGVVVESATTTGDGLFVQVRTTEPGHGCVVLAVITHPADVALLPRSDGTVHFVEDKVVHECE